MKTDEFEIIEVFPTAVADVTLLDRELLDNLEKEIYEEMKRDPEGESLSNMGGWQSARDSGIGPITQSLRKSLLPLVQKYYDETIGRCDMTEKLKITGMWANVSGKGSFNQEHVHPGANVSGVLYVKVPKNAAYINFINPNRGLKMHVSEVPIEVNKYNSESFFFGPTKGRLLLFPSWLSHSVDMTESDGDRISLAFNASYYIKR